MKVCWKIFFIGISKELALDVVSKVGLNKQKEETADVILKLYNLFLEKDALLIEVNPYAESISTGGCTWDILILNLLMLLLVWKTICIKFFFRLLLGC